MNIFSHWSANLHTDIKVQFSFISFYIEILADLQDDYFIWTDRIELIPRNRA